MWVAWAAPTSWIRSSEDPENARPFNEVGRFPQVLAALTEVSFDDIDTNKDGVITPEDQDLRYRDLYRIPEGLGRMQPELDKGQRHAKALILGFAVRSLCGHGPLNSPPQPLDWCRPAADRNQHCFCYRPTSKSVKALKPNHITIKRSAVFAL